MPWAFYLCLPFAPCALRLFLTCLSRIESVSYRLPDEYKETQHYREHHEGRNPKPWGLKVALPPFMLRQERAAAGGAPAGGAGAGGAPGGGGGVEP